VVVSTSRGKERALTGVRDGGQSSKMVSNGNIETTAIDGMIVDWAMDRDLSDLETNDGR